MKELLHPWIRELCIGHRIVFHSAGGWRSGMNPDQRETLRQALRHTRERIAALEFSACDKDEVRELMDRVESEIEGSHPNNSVVAGFLNSIARSLRTEPAAHKVCAELDAAMRQAGIPTTWETLP